MKILIFILMVTVLYEDLPFHETCKKDTDGTTVCEGHLYGPVSYGNN